MKRNKAENPDLFIGSVDERPVPYEKMREDIAELELLMKSSPSVPRRPETQHQYKADSY
jgi:hypothetical protein